MIDTHMVPAQELQFTEEPNWDANSYARGKYAPYVQQLRANAGKWAKLFETSDSIEINRWRAALRRHADIRPKQFTRPDGVIEFWAVSEVTAEKDEES